MTKLEWAIHRLPENPSLFGVGFRQLTQAETEKLLLTFAEIQASRGDTEPMEFDRD